MNDQLKLYFRSGVKRTNLKTLDGKMREKILGILERNVRYLLGRSVMGIKGISQLQSRKSWKNLGLCAKVDENVNGGMSAKI